MPHHQSNYAVDLLAVADAAQVLAPGCLLGITEQVGPGNVMVVAEFGPAQAGEVGFCAVGAGPGDAVAVLVINAAHGKAGVQRVPGQALIGMDRDSSGNTLADAGQGWVFGGEHLWQRTATTLAHHHDGPALARVVLGQPPIDPVGRQVLRPDMAGEISALDLGHASFRRSATPSCWPPWPRAACAPARTRSCIERPGRGRAPSCSCPSPRLPFTSLQSTATASS